MGLTIRSLDLRYCAGMNAFFSKVAKLGLTPTKLRTFRALGIISMDLLQNFLFTLAGASHLEELSLCLGSAMHPICLHCIEPHAPALKLLILDFRAVLHDVDSAIQYSADQFEDILARFPRLISLGLPLQLKDPVFDRYKRAKFKSQDLHTKALRTLHIRRRCTPWKRFARDAMHAAAPFQRRRSGFTVLLDRGHRLRKMVFSAQAPPRPAAIDTVERENLCTEF
ncbi:hypothetical protein MY11210_009050 [Beauveria gryllotalpidicola]